MLCEMQSARPGFELVSLCPFPTTITITPQAPPNIGCYAIKSNRNKAIPFTLSLVRWAVLSTQSLSCLFHVGHLCFYSLMRNINVTIIPSLHFTFHVLATFFWYCLLRLNRESVSAGSFHPHAMRVSLYLT